MSLVFDVLLSLLLSVFCLSIKRGIKLINEFKEEEDFKGYSWKKYLYVIQILVILNCILMLFIFK